MRPKLAIRERLAVNPLLRVCAERWAANVADVLSERKARGRFLMFGVTTGGIAEYADEILRRREQDEERGGMDMHRNANDSRWAEQASIRNSFSAKWFGAPINVWARRIDLPPGEC